MGVIQETYASFAASVTGAGQPFELKRAAIRGVEYEVFANAPPSLRVSFETVAQMNAEKVALVIPEKPGMREITYSELRHRVSQVGHSLRNTNVGVKKGDRVVLCLNKCVEVFILQCFPVASITFVNEFN
ncbi:hypothetical protein HK100_009060 [Physocladia obscura]|uniref:AMP-dependent synthetase/ligase domain-containing protein n=1 Tax=Physocladia obscura TaxID=109957 RepID=A0AAD5T3I8_9FUNG|nr:hypothetical protein HK100_009060 [Physocladia obscura]